MSLRLLAADGTLAAWAPASPPKGFLAVDSKEAGPLAAARARSAAAAAGGALTFLGYEPIAAPAGKADLRLAVGLSSGEGAVFSDELHYFCLKTHPRKPLVFSREGLSAASAELGNLRASVRSLSGVSLEPSSRGVTGYLHRFREALSRDFDFPEALSCVWDGLRPGALSPGSKAALLRAALPALGLE